MAVWLGALDEGIETFQVEFQATEEAGVFTGWPEEGNRFLLVCDRSPSLPTSCSGSSIAGSPA